jgi:isopenicillin N synthase-like dioxygenase
MDTAAVPVVDIAPFLDGSGRQQVVAAVGHANEQIGFLVITGHGVPAIAVEAVHEQAHEFFALPLEEKLRYSPEVSWYFRGYEAVGGSALARSAGEESPPDLCELFRVSRFDDPAMATAAGSQPGLEYFFAPNIWPDRPSGLRDALVAYYGYLEALAADLMRIFALALGLSEEHFDPYIDRHITNLCLNHYPGQKVPPQPGQLRRGAHSDYGSLTILHQDDAPGGLQVRTGEGACEQWHDVPHIPGAYVINIGDLMARWTNDRWVSTVHRVVNPPWEFASRDRISIPFFHQPNYDAVVECLPSCQRPDDPPRYDPVTSGEWVQRQTRRQVGADPPA